MLTIERCRELVNLSDTFKEKMELIDGYKVYKYSYLIQTEDIITYSAEELRGVTFVKDSSGNFRRFLMLHKFYNVGQVPQTEIEILKNKNIVRVSTKMDGSLVAFYQLPNKKIYPMTKGSFNNPVLDQVLSYKNYKNIENFVSELFNKNIYPIFEWVSPQNRIVLHYEDESLTLLQIRDIDGKYLDLKKFDNLTKKYGVNKTKYWDKDNLDSLLSLRDEMENFEGWVIQFDDNSIVKLKTAEYFELHKTLSGLNLKTIFKLIIDDELDDYKDKLTEKGNMFIPYKKSAIINMEKNIQNYIFESLKRIDKILEDDKSLSIKDFAIKYKSDSLFSILIRAKREPIDKLSMLKELMLKRHKTVISIEKLITNF